MAHKIQIKRGNKADLPTLDAGEFGLCQDTNELFIGNNGNQKIFPPGSGTYYGVASGTDTYVSTITEVESLFEGLGVRVKFINANTGPATLNINDLGAKAIVKSNGSALAAGNIKAGQICHLVYNGANFQLLGEGGEYGTATASDVLSGKTIGTENGLVTGTMPNRGAVTNTITTQGGQYTIPSGYHNGSGKVTASFANLTAGNVKKGVNIGGVVGNVIPMPTFSLSDFNLISDKDGTSIIQKASNSVLLDKYSTVVVNYFLSIADFGNYNQFTLTSDGAPFYYSKTTNKTGSWYEATSYSGVFGTDGTVIFNPHRANISITSNNMSLRIYGYIL